jgi:hypothetical protein
MPPAHPQVIPHRPPSSVASSAPLSPLPTPTPRRRRPRPPSPPSPGPGSRGPASAAAIAGAGGWPGGGGPEEGWPWGVGEGAEAVGGWGEEGAEAVWARMRAEEAEHGEALRALQVPRGGAGPALAALRADLVHPTSVQCAK